MNSRRTPPVVLKYIFALAAATVIIVQQKIFGSRNGIIFTSNAPGVHNRMEKVQVTSGAFVGEERVESLLPFSSSPSRPNELELSAYESNNRDSDLESALPIQQISLVGERNSGTRWIYDHLLQCFGGQNVAVKNRLIRHKHWFQHDIIPELRFNRTLVIAQFRDPFYWVDGMMRKPHHAPMHYKLPWRVFLETPWTMPERPTLDRQYVKSVKKNSFNVFNDTAPIFPCQENFQPHQIISCLLKPFDSEEDFQEYMAYWRVNLSLPSFSGREPFYELKNDGSGQNYKNILEMRADKIHNFLSLSTWNWIADVHVVQYEQVLNDGTGGLLSYIEEKTGLTRNCTAYQPQLDRASKYLDYELVEWINDHHDWEAESLIGYSKWEV